MKFLFWFSQLFEKNHWLHLDQNEIAKVLNKKSLYQCNRRIRIRLALFNTLYAVCLAELQTVRIERVILTDFIIQIMCLRT